MTAPQPAGQWLAKTLEEGAQSVTIACISSVTDEQGGFVVTPSTTLDDVMTAYVLQFPKEFEVYKLKIKDVNSNLHTTTGMGKEGRMMAITQIPEFVLWCMRAIKRDYWDDKKRCYDFVRRCPAFMIGDKTKKSTTGVIIK